MRDLNVTEVCCQPLPATADEEAQGPRRSQSWRELREAELEAGEGA